MFAIARSSSRSFNSSLFSGLTFYNKKYILLVLFLLNESTFRKDKEISNNSISKFIGNVKRLNGSPTDTNNKIKKSELEIWSLQTFSFYRITAPSCVLASFEH
jgi:hypothetical protein